MESNSSTISSIDHKQHTLLRVNVSNELKAQSNMSLWFVTHSAICPQGCRNGGICVVPGICSCPEGWMGGACHTGKFPTTKHIHMHQRTCTFVSLLYPPLLDCSVIHSSFMQVFSEGKSSAKCIFQMWQRISHLASCCVYGVGIYKPFPPNEHPLFLLSVAVCTQLCLNGGKCISPNKCHCRPPFSGPQCEERKQSH